MTFGEAIRLVRLLRADTTSQVAAACEGWLFPASREALAIFDLFDLEHQVNSDPKKRPKPHSGRPFKIDDSQVTKRGNAGNRTPAEVKELLRQMARGEAPV